MALKEQLKDKVNSLQSNVVIEFKPRLNQKIIDLLNTQIGNELFNSHFYKGIAAWCSNGPWSNGYEYFMKRGAEEQEHANKIIEYLDEKNCKINIPTVEAPCLSYIDIRDIAIKGLEKEIATTCEWELIASTAKELGDNTTYLYSDWFLNEQISEEVEGRELLYKLDLGMPNWKIEEYFEELNKG